MAGSNTTPKVLIIGAGLAGLSLAQGLKQAGIPFHIFERDTTVAFRAQGYRIRISPDGAEALQRLLPDRLWKAFEATCSDVVHGGRHVDALTAEAVKWDRPRPAPKFVQTTQGPIGQDSQRAPDKAYNVDRAVLRSVLLCGLEEYVSFGKRLQKFETSDGEVTVSFADGTSERGWFLVGADGIRSVVRQQLLPGMTVLDTEGRAVFGKTPIEETLFDHIPHEIGNGICLIGESFESRMKLFCDVMKFDRSKTSDHERQLGIHIPVDYIYWVLVFRNDVVSLEEERALLSLSNEQSAKKAVDLTATWNLKIRSILTNQAVDAASTLAFLTCTTNFDSEWSEKPSEVKGIVTLIGDSSHPMPPVGGLGANAGFQDAADLYQALMKRSAATEQTERDALIGAFEQKMLQRAKLVVEISSGGAGNFFGMKPISELKAATIWH